MLATICHGGYGCQYPLHCNEHEQNDGFHERNPIVYVSAENAAGFLDRAGNSWKRNHADRISDWGTREVSPRFFTGENHRDTAATLSVREDVESIYAFCYHGFHAEVLSKRHEWFVEGPSDLNTCTTTDRPLMPSISKVPLTPMAKDGNVIREHNYGFHKSAGLQN